MQDAVVCYGLWIRHHRGEVQVLHQTWPSGEWRQVYRGECVPGTCHIVNPGGISSSPIVDVDKDFEPKTKKTDAESLFKEES